MVAALPESGAGRRFSGGSVLPGFGLSLGFTLLYLTLIILIPLSTILLKTFDLTWAVFWATVSAPRALAAYRLSVGASWQWTGKGMMGVDIEESSRVAGSETVEVPAGKFQAMKVETRIVQGGTPVTKFYWFANWVGLIKSMTDTGSVKSITELLDYSFRKSR